MPTDAFFHLDRLRCLVETDRDGHSEPYVWTLLIWLDDLTIASEQLVAGSAPGNVEAARAVIKEGIRAGEEAQLGAAQQALAHRFEDGLGMRRIGIVAAMFEQDDTPSAAVRAAYDAFVRELPKALSEFIRTNLRAPNEEERQQIVDQVRPLITNAGSDALSAFEKTQVFLGNLNLDDEIGFDTRFVDLDDDEIPGTFTLRFVGVREDVVVDHYEIDGRFEIREPPPPETCQAEKDAVTQARKTVDGIEAMIEGLQADLQEASPSEKAGIIAEIRRLRNEELPEAAEALEKAQRALATCRG